jgi:hypothetical protein
VDSLNEMPAVVLDLLADQERIDRISKENQNFITRKVSVPCPSSLSFSPHSPCWPISR